MSQLQIPRRKNPIGHIESGVHLIKLFMIRNEGHMLPSTIGKGENNSLRKAVCTGEIVGISCKVSQITSMLAFFKLHMMAR